MNSGASRIVIVVIGIILMAVLIPVVIGFMNEAYVPTTQSGRYPIFANNLGQITPVVMQFWPVLLFVAAGGMAYGFWRAYQSRQAGTG